MSAWIDKATGDFQQGVRESRVISSFVPNARPPAAHAQFVCQSDLKPLNSDLESGFLILKSQDEQT